MKEIRKIAIFFDGTWNTVENPEKYSNVKKLKDLVAERYSDHEQDTCTITDTFYSGGPGTTPEEKMTGGAFAADFGHILCDAYIWLCRKYMELQEQSCTPEIYLFGFSRGSYLAHLFSWILNDAGVIGKFSGIPGLITAFLWKNNKEVSKILEEIPASGRHAVKVRMLGLWDMVSAPLDLFSGFHDGERAPAVQSICHAMSLDEKRVLFPVLKYASNDERVRQCWFSGVHSDVGGGYEDSTLSDIALNWMIEQAVEEDLIIMGEEPDPGQKIDFIHIEKHDESKGQNRCRIYEGEPVDSSVYARMEQDKSYFPAAKGFPS